MSCRFQHPPLQIGKKLPKVLFFPCACLLWGVLRSTQAKVHLTFPAISADLCGSQVQDPPDWTSYRGQVRDHGLVRIHLGLLSLGGSWKWRTGNPQNRQAGSGRHLENARWLSGDTCTTCHNFAPSVLPGNLSQAVICRQGLMDISNGQERTRLILWLTSLRTKTQLVQGDALMELAELTWRRQRTTLETSGNQGVFFLHSRPQGVRCKNWPSLDVYCYK